MARTMLITMLPLLPRSAGPQGCRRRPSTWPPERVSGKMVLGRGGGRPAAVSPGNDAGGKACLAGQNSLRQRPAGHGCVGRCDGKTLTATSRRGGPRAGPGTPPLPLAQKVTKADDRDARCRMLFGFARLRRGGLRTRLKKKAAAPSNSRSSCPFGSFPNKEEVRHATKDVRCFTAGPRRASSGVVAGEGRCCRGPPEGNRGRWCWTRWP